MAYLSCSCGEWDGDGWGWRESGDFRKMGGKRRSRCCSCKTLIDIGADCLRFDRFRSPITEIEERICGDEVELAPYWMCEKCGEIFLNLDEAGFCLDITENMADYMKEYREMVAYHAEEREEAKKSDNLL